MSKTTIHRLAAVALLAAGTTIAAPAPAQEGARYREAMASVLASVRVLTIANAASGGSTTPEREAEILAALDELADQASMLAEHAGAYSDEAEFLAASLERYATWTRDAYERGQRERAREMVRQLTDLCVACHTRRRTRTGSVLARDFVESDSLAALDARERARLEVATRQFGAALSSLEAALPAAEADDPRLVADLTTYVVVAVRVLGEDVRALAFVEGMRGRGDLGAALRLALERWSQDLRALIDDPPAGTLDAAQALFARAEAASALEHAGVVGYAAATEIAQRLVEEGPLGPGELARAYLLLGVSELRLHPQSWIPQAELHLEQAIRTAPGTETSARAFEQLAGRLASAYAGPAGPVPPEIAEHLDRLRAIAYQG